MNYQKSFWVSIYNSFRDRGGGLVSPPPSIKVRIGARSVRVKKHVVYFDNFSPSFTENDCHITIIFRIMIHRTIILHVISKSSLYSILKTYACRCQILCILDIQ